MSWIALALCAQLAAPATFTLPVLAFPERGLDDSAAYQGYQTRLFRDAAGNTLQVYLDSRANRVVHLWADGEDESLGFTARGADGSAAKLRWNDAGALVSRSAQTRTFEHALVADEQRIVIGWFQLGSMRVERDLQYANRQQRPFAEAPYALPELERLLAALATLSPAEHARHLELLHADSDSTLRGRLRPTITSQQEGASWVTRVAQPALDGLDTLVLELRTDPRRVKSLVEGDSVSLQAIKGARVPFAVRISTSGRALTPLARGEIFTDDFLAFLRTSRGTSAPRDPLAARRTERQVRGLELLASREKLMAGLPTYATYFGRDMLMTALMMRPVWREGMSEFVLASALRKLSPTGQVSHEEALGDQAVREAAAEYAALVEQSVRARGAGDQRAADSALTAARTVLHDLRRTRENYHMIDAELQLPIVAARWLTDPNVSADRKRAFLLDASDGGEPRLVRLLRELALVARITAPYAANPVTSNLISFAPRDSGRWASQSWRDSNVGYAGGRYAMDVNAIWAPHALEAAGRVLEALRAIDLPPDSMRRLLPELAGDAPLGRYSRDRGALRHDLEAWQGAARHFLVRLSPSEVRVRTTARITAMSDDERRHWIDVLARTHADADSLSFLALSLDTDGRPIAVANSDAATRLFLGDAEGPHGAPDPSARAAVLRDVRLFVRAYPVGLLVDSVGVVVSNDAYAPPRVWRDFDADRYHSPHVVWGRENNLFLIGAMSRLADVQSLSRSDAGVAAYARELRAAIDRVHAAVDASGFHSELWSYEVRNGRAVPIRYGSGSDVQLWSTTDLVVQYELARHRR